MEIQDRLAPLRKLHTRKLIQMLRATYTRSYEYALYHNDPTEHDFSIEFTEEDIKSVLATRPHMPNKVEGEQIRRDKAKTRRNARNNRYVRSRV